MQFVERELCGGIGYKQHEKITVRCLIIKVLNNTEFSVVVITFIATSMGNFTDFTDMYQFLNLI